MASQHIRAQGRTTADPATVFGVLRDGSLWPRFCTLGSYELVTAGADSELGEERIFHTGRIHVREEIVELIQDRRLSYVLLSGLAVRDYRADIDLEPVEDGTLIRWHSSFDPKLWGTGWLYRWQLSNAIHSLVDGLGEYAASVASRGHGHTKR